MSGFEIAGVVLGAFPIVIETLDKYREVARMWDFWWEIRSEYQKCSSEVKFHRLSFNQNLKQLLLPLVADQAQIQQLLAEPGGDIWQQPSIEQQLVDRLQDSYELYLDIIQQLQRTMQDLNDELAIDKSEVQRTLANPKEKKTRGDVKTTDALRRLFGKPNREYQLYRAKFTVGEAKRKVLFAELKEYNKRLEKLLTTSDAIADLESKRKKFPWAAKSATDVSVSHFWRHADRLYQVLSRAWGCRCASQHRANILLQHKTLTDLEFVLLFLGGLNSPNIASNMWQLQEARVKLIDPPETNKLFTQITILPSEHNTSMQSVHIAQSKQSKTSASSLPQSALSTTDTLARAQPPLATGKDEIQDLCTALALNTRSSDGYGFLEDSHKRYYIYPLSNDASTLRGDEPVSLDDLLRRKHSPPLNRRQRYTLALTLASSFVQLWESAWLPPSSWNRTDILFLRDANRSNYILLDRPYLSHKPVSPPTVQSNQANGPSGIPFLGILLLELCFGVLVEETSSRQQYPSGDPEKAQVFDQLVAVEWLQDVGDEAGQDFAEAATWCLIGSRSLGSRDDWRQMLFEKVVQPLETCQLSLNPCGAGTSRRIV